jgi:hypothetical protein
MNKQELLNGLKDENQKWQAFLDQIGLARMDQPGVAGSWSIKDIVAHLTGWRRLTVARLRAARNGKTEALPPWPAGLKSEYEINEWIFNNSHKRPIQEILDESSRVFQEFIDAFEYLPEEILANISALPWMEGQPLSAGVFFSHFHEEHEPDMRAWLMRIKKK